MHSSTYPAGFGPRRLGYSPTAICADVPRKQPETAPKSDRLAELEDALADAVAQRDRAFAEWQSAQDDEYLLTVYRANVVCVHDLEHAIGKLMGGRR